MKMLFLLCVFAILFGSESCQWAKSETEADEIITIVQKENKKYDLTATFYGINFKAGDEDESGTKIITYIVFRDNKSGVEVRYKPTSGNNEETTGINSIVTPDFYFTDIWSPDEELIALPIGMFDGIAVFRAKNALDAIKGNKYFDTIKVGSRNSAGNFYYHRFESWEDDSTFGFRAGLDGDMFAFKYNAEKGELYCYQEKCEDFDIGYNIKGKTKAVEKGNIAIKIEH